MASTSWPAPAINAATALIVIALSDVVRDHCRAYQGTRSVTRASCQPRLDSADRLPSVTRSRLFAPAALACAVAVALVGCADDSSAVCLSGEAGKVCVEDSDGSVRFFATGLAPRSALTVAEQSGDPATYVVDEDGNWEPEGLGFLYAVAGTTLTFAVRAVEVDGSELAGNLTLVAGG